MRTMIACGLATCLAACATHPVPNDGLATQGDEKLGAGHFRVYLSNNGFADQQVVEEAFNRRVRDLCGGSFAPLDVRYGGRIPNSDHDAGVRKGFIPLNAEVVCTGS